MANVGPGFDSVALAVDLAWDRVVASRSWDFEFFARGDVPSDPERNSAGAAALRVLREYAPGSGVRVVLEKGIPPGLGLGSSGASAAAAVAAVDRLLGIGLEEWEAVRLAAEGELAGSGALHYDNVSASLLGGMTVVSPSDRVVLRVDPPEDLRLLVFVPEAPGGEGKTRAAREILPRSVGFREAVENLSRAAVLVAAAGLGRADVMGRVLSDNLAEPFRAGTIPGYGEAKEAALAAGASGFNICGAGPSTFALVEPGSEGRVSRAVVEAFWRAGLRVRPTLTRPAGGAEVVG